jgi:peroxiredoxin
VNDRKIGWFLWLIHVNHPVFTSIGDRKTMFPKFVKYWNVWIVSVLLLGIGWIWWSYVPADLTSNTGIALPRQGFLAPEFTLQSIDGENITLSELRGNVVLVNFWASWCPPCKAEMPAMQSVYDDYHDQGFTILAINSTIQDQRTSAVDFAQSLGLNFPILFDPDGYTTNTYNIDALPTSLFIDRAGKIHEVVIGGPMPEAMLRERIEKLLTGN